MIAICSSNGAVLYDFSHKKFPGMRLTRPFVRIFTQNIYPHRYILVRLCEFSHKTRSRTTSPRPFMRNFIQNAFPCRTPALLRSFLQNNAHRRCEGNPSPRNQRSNAISPIIRLRGCDNDTEPQPLQRRTQPLQRHRTAAVSNTDLNRYNDTDRSRCNADLNRYNDTDRSRFNGRSSR